eukprot:jgi/Hompol1/610/HPOL_005383-RA
MPKTSRYANQRDGDDRGDRRQPPSSSGRRDNYDDQDDDDESVYAAGGNGDFQSFYRGKATAKPQTPPPSNHTAHTARPPRTEASQHHPPPSQSPSRGAGRGVAGAGAAAGAQRDREQEREWDSSDHAGSAERGRAKPRGGYDGRGKRRSVRDSLMSIASADGRSCGLTVGCWIILGIIGALLVALALIGYFLWPRYPTFSILSVTANDTTTVYPITVGGYMFNTTLRLTIAVNNPNKYSMSFSALSLTSKLKIVPSDFNNVVQFVGKSPLQAAAGVTDLAKSTWGNLVAAPNGVTTFTDLAHAINYYTTPNGSDDPGLAELISGCGVISGSGTHIMSASYFASLDGTAISSLGFHPTSFGSFDFACPPSLGAMIRATYSTSLAP